jgi:hypothetical protein
VILSGMGALSQLMQMPTPAQPNKQSQDGGADAFLSYLNQAPVQQQSAEDIETQVEQQTQNNQNAPGISFAGTY